MRQLYSITLLVVAISACLSPFGDADPTSSHRYLKNRDEKESDAETEEREVVNALLIGDSGLAKSLQRANSVPSEVTRPLQTLRRSNSLNDLTKKEEELAAKWLQGRNKVADEVATDSKVLNEAEKSVEKVVSDPKLLAKAEKEVEDIVSDPKVLAEAEKAAQEPRVVEAATNFKENPTPKTKASLIQRVKVAILGKDKSLQKRNALRIGALVTLLLLVLAIWLAIRPQPSFPVVMV